MISTMEPWIILLFIGLVITGLDLLLHIKKSTDIKVAQNHMFQAKKEAQEIAAFPLNNPYPLIQLNQNKEIIFINPAALEAFTDISTLGKKHPVLDNIDLTKNPDKVMTNEATYNNTVYYQTIIPTKADQDPTWIIYSYDITDRKKYEHELKRAYNLAEDARQEAEKANQARGDFLANMSHELRTPMNGIIGLTDLLMEAKLSAEHRELIDAVNSSARNLLILLNDLLDFSKIEAGELSMESISFDLHKVIHQVERLQGPVAKSKGLNLKHQITPNTPRFIIGDPSRLQQILNNLINNALKFTAEGSVTISVDAKEQKDKNHIIRITVQDTGIGIPEDKQKTVFAKFQQADTSTARKYGGTGLGLSITKNLTELMGGQISLKSMVGEGTAFTILLPAKEAEASMIDQADQQGPLNINNAANIMIVDDHPVNLLFMNKLMSHFGFTNIHEAKNGKEAISLFQQNQYDLIFMDCQMPEMDGFTAARNIRDIETAESDPVIIAVTADAMKGAEEKCMASGMDDYISKPVDKDKLRQLLQEWLPGDHEMSEHTESTAPIETTEIFHWDQLYDVTEGDTDMEKKLIGLFMENLQADISHLQSSLADKNYEEWDSAVHKLYGACAHFGAHAMAALCDEAQSLSEGNINDIEKIHHLIIHQYKQLRDLFQENQRAA
jgi:signal transduction histidine kinase/CheY-like chemotaxis protein/HPt (histidine-containing phosphotransfer) domain-containing protein